MVKIGFVGENELTRMLSNQYRLPAVDLEKVDVDIKIFKLIDILRFKTRYHIEPVIDRPR